MRIRQKLMLLKGDKPSHFLPKVELIANLLRDNDVDELVSPWIYQEADWKVAMHGIESLLGLDGIFRRIVPCSWNIQLCEHAWHFGER